jgi:hypothetical protein
VSLGSLTAGSHTIVITVREPGAGNLLDLMLITSNLSMVPTDTDVCFPGATASPRALRRPVGTVPTVSLVRGTASISVANVRPGSVVEVVRLDGAVMGRAVATRSGSAVVSAAARGTYFVRVTRRDGRRTALRMLMP